MDLLMIALGVGLLAAGGEVLIRGALAAARRLRVSPLLVGLVVVGFGTSTPELVVSLDAALSGQSDIAVGNVVGSNVANVLLILGLCALALPLAVSATALRRDAVAVVAASLLVSALLIDGAVVRVDGLVLLAAFLAYLVWAYRSERAVASDDLPQATTPLRPVRWIVGAVLLGLVVLVAGSRVLLAGALGLADALGVPPAVVGLTLVAVGTSLPELAVSIVATLRRHADVAVGNVLGSNVFNALGILGVAALASPLEVAPRVAQVDHWVMLGTAVLLLGVLASGRRVSRWEGGLLLSLYVGYVVVSFTLLAT